jgi:acetoin utilization deacetylase AcuC-like enzyme
MPDFLERQASEQYLTSSQFLAQDLRQVISLPQTRQVLLGKNDLFPLKPAFSDRDIPTYRKTNRLMGIRYSRDSPLKAFYTDHYVLPLPPGHRFPMEKYSQLRDLVTQLDGVELVEAPAVSDTQILYAHDPSYLVKVISGSLSPKEQQEIGFPWSELMVERSRRSAGATVAAAKAALNEGLAANLAGGTHHAYRNMGSGFCVFNDSAIVARVLQKEIHPKLKVAIVDLDVHQGNGTASILQNDSSIFTLSIHGENNFPFTKEQSDLDIGLPNGCEDGDYLKALNQGLEILDKFKPDFIIYLAGADPHEGDRLGKLNISKVGMRQRDETVFQYGRDRQIPIAFSMAGGYGKEIQTTVDIHFQTIQVALGLRRDYFSPITGDSTESSTEA